VTQLISRLRALAVLLLALLPLLSSPVPVANPAPGSARIVGVEPVNDRWVKISVYSPSMDKVIFNDVYKAPGNASAPVLYLLNGIDGGLDNKGWFGLTDIQGFFANKKVNVVSPIGGQYSYYTDWVADDPALGRNKWQTYLTQELPPLIDQQLKANGRNAIGCLSMGGGAALDLVIQAPGLYRAAGCSNLRCKSPGTPLSVPPLERGNRQQDKVIASRRVFAANFNVRTRL
jgi:diacylglycerol O-acyltransferase/trehalose O-mycolyltransferase